MARPEKEKAPSANWSDPHLTELLLQSISTALHRKTGVDIGLTKGQWESVVKDFQATSGNQWTKAQLQSRLSFLRSLFSLYKELSNLSGWSVDDSGRILQDSSVWDDVIRRAENESGSSTRQRVCQLRILKAGPLPHHELMVYFHK